MRATDNYNKLVFDDELSDKLSRLIIMRRMMVCLAYELIGAKGMLYTNEEAGQSYVNGFDCSGFVCTITERAAEVCELDISMPRHANVQWRVFGEPVDYRQRQPGDLVYFPSRSKNGTRVIGHVGLVVSNDHYIHSPGVNGSRVSLSNLPLVQEELQRVSEGDLYTRTPAGIKRVSVPIGSGRWHAR